MKKAVCFGINNYPNPQNNLKGCINDMYEWEHLFSTLGFEITCIQDDEVTTDRFLTELTFALIESVPGDVIVFTYSGHGTQVYDADGDEQDGYDEALYLYDGALIDDLIRDSLSLLATGVHFIFISDSCFSGSVTRKIPTTAYNVQRFIRTSNIPATVNRKRPFLDQADMVDVLLSGCNDHEYSYDALIAGSFHGAFSYFATRSYKWGQTFTNWYDAIRKELPSAKYPQTPILEGNAKILNTIAFTDSNPEDPNISKPTWWTKYKSYVAIGLFIFVVIAGILYGLSQ